jgi:hypothetical protein
MKATVHDVAKRSWRVEEFAHRNSISRAKAYLELKEGRLTSLPAFKSSAA